MKKEEKRCMMVPLLCRKKRCEMKKMLMMATTAAMIEQFNKNNILILIDMGYEVHVAGNFEKGNPISEKRLDEFKVWLKEKKCKWFNIPSTRKPTDYNNIEAYKKVIELINEYRYEFIHCHTPIGSVIARCAAHKTHTPVIYTAHGFHFYKGAPLKNWLIYYPVEKFLSRWTDLLILINKEDYDRAKLFRAKEVFFVPGVGIDLNKFNTVKIDKNEKKKQLGIQEDEFMILSVGELIPRKNHEIVIKALSVLNQRKQLDNIKYVICGQGGYKEHLEKLAKDLEVEKYVHFLGYRSDISEICKCSDLFVFMSYQEGLSVALMEAMASGIPIVCSNIRGNNDLIANEVNGLMPNNTSEDLASAIIKMKENPSFRENMASAALKSIKKYDIENVKIEMQKIYSHSFREVK